MLLDEFLKTGTDKKIRDYLLQIAALQVPGEIWNWPLHLLKWLKISQQEILAET